MKKILVMAAGALLSSPLLAAPYIDNEAPLVAANAYLDLADAGGRVVAVGDRGKILFSDDQGGHWKTAVAPSEVLLTAVCFADARHGWAVGHDAVVLGTDDGGETWTLQYSDPLGGGESSDVEEEPLDDLSMDDIYGDPYGDDDYGDDLYSDDPYEEASSAPVDTSGAPLLDVHCESKDKAVAVGGYGYYLETSDGGDTWSKQAARMKNSDGWHLYAMSDAPKSDDRYVVGEKGVIFRSTDKGASWTQLDSPYDGTLFGVTAISDYQVLVYGLQGNVWLSANRGVSWKKIPTKLTRGVNDGAVLADGSVVLVTNAGGILTCHDDGQSFSLRFLPDRESISAVLPRIGGGVLIAGQGGLRVIEDVK